MKCNYKAFNRKYPDIKIKASVKRLFKEEL